MAPLRRDCTQALLLVVLLSLAGRCALHRGNSFTDWMGPNEFASYLNDRETRQADGKNFWARGHWINAVEGRWHKGSSEFRIKVGEAPSDRRYWWYWWFNQTPEDFDHHIRRLSDEGFTLVHSDSFQRPDGTTRHCGVWQKVE
jgi:hypothetical protein